MSNVDVEIASRKYSVACRDGEESHLQTLAAIVDKKAQEAAEAVGTLSESRQLLFASLLLADELMEQRSGSGAPITIADPAVAQALEGLAERIEELAERLEKDAPTP